MLRSINQTFHQNNKKCSWDKTGEGNVLLHLAFSAQKYPKIITQERDIFQGINRIYGVQGILGMWQLVLASCQRLISQQELGGPLELTRGGS